MCRHRWIFFTILFASLLTRAADAQEGPKNALVLIIRHAENPDTGRGLSPRGHQRAEAYKDFFLNFSVDSKKAVPDTIFAANDSKHSHRPRLTVEPFAKAAKLQIDTRFGSKQSSDLAGELRGTQQGKRILICWRHGNIPDLLRALGAIPETLLPRGKWPGATYDWLLLLSFDQDGRLIPASSKRINEHLLPGDSE